LDALPIYLRGQAAAERAGEAAQVADRTAAAVIPGDGAGGGRGGRRAHGERELLRPGVLHVQRDRIWQQRLEALCVEHRLLRAGPAQALQVALLGNPEVAAQALRSEEHT